MGNTAGTFTIGKVITLPNLIILLLFLLVSDKRRLNTFLAVDFVAVMGFYCLLLMSSVFGFNAEDIDDVYTLNFLEPAFFKYLLQVG